MSNLASPGPLVSPSPASASTDDTPNASGPLHLDTVRQNGQEVTVVRDAEGHIVFPTEVPPATTSPTSPERSAIAPPPAPPRSKSHQPEPQQPPSKQRDSPGPDAHPRLSKSEPIGPRADHRRKQPSRPRMGTPGPGLDGQGPSNRSATTTGARDRRAFTFPHKMKRSGTNISQLNRAMTSYGGYTSSSESSESESDSDSEQQQHKQYGRFHIGNEHYRTRGRVSKRDGRLSISLKDTSNTGYLAKALGTAARKLVPLKPDEGESRPHLERADSGATEIGPDTISCPKLNIVIMVIGSRGDAQPFLKVGKVLKEQYGHRVRIATHPAFREFVEKDSGLEFFSVGGDPSELMAFMVKNPGMIPTLESVKAGDIGRRRAAMAEMFDGFWRACINATDDEKDTRNLKMMGERDPFVADAIIANPPSFAHIHCAEALGIPLHLMFTFPYTPTQAFPHPLASIKKSNVDPGYTNFISYPLVEMMVWQGLGDLVNNFRVKTLGLDPVSTLWAPGATYRLHVPFTYMWSPGLVSKPSDWGPEVDVSGFVFLDLASTFKPPSPLTTFLSASEEPPIYIGFGSIVVDDANRFTNMIFDAVKLAGVRALVSKGWGGLGGDSLDVPDNILFLDNTPHDWLFPKVRACVIHGGAGTTAIALKCGKPTMIVPFFGDQHFWGSMVGNAGAGPEPVPYKSLTAEKLAEGIKYLLTDEAVKAAGEIAKSIEKEGDGAENACKAFHKHLVLAGKNSMRCSILRDKVAVWQLKNTNLRLSAMAADVVVDRGYVSWKKLRLLRHNEWNDFEGPGEPVTGVAGSLVSSAGKVFKGIGGVPYRIAKGREERRERKERRRRRAVKKSEGKAGDGDGKDKKEEVEENNEEGKQATDGGKGGTNGKRKEDGEDTESRPGPPDTTEAVDHAADSGENAPDEEEAKNIKTTTSNAIHRRDTQQTTSTTATDEDTPAEEFVTQVGRGAYKSASALARAPVDLSLALVQGFHNAPRLYGDDTVRRPIRVTGIKSGLHAAGHEFVYGIYDGWTGLVRLPVRGARDGGLRGFVTGVGMGVTGFVLKDIAALFGPVGYTLKGVVKQAERGRQPIKYIRRARIMQGQREMSFLSELEKKQRAEDVIKGWDIMRSLWAALDLEEKKKGGLKVKLGMRKRGKRGLGAVFESVETAERAFVALKRGEGVESVVGQEKGREGEDRGKSSAIAAKEKKKGSDVKGSEKRSLEQRSNKGAADDGESGDRPDVGQEKVRVNGGGLKGASGSNGAVTDPTLPNGGLGNVDGAGGGIGLSDDDAFGEEKTPVEESENPFSPSHKDVEKNKAENQRMMARVNGRA
ncbi:sterol 3-beta-glucosyltransferase [Podospora aff. communis PSN243]|uniref:Sterol 3-beta-glucosyltransferase n=1 Tax=Podospora aff. communis PSN243 TaxID=3040156 RepID=A0AAV9G659_9PEZI|nr:sterol 3-beta-glucosyltransferase [Podospora aff. communis PSN243]